MTPKVTRPKITKGPTIRKETGCGNLYVTINTDGNGSGPIEVICRIGKNGGCTQCQSEALTRAITIGLKYGVPLVEFVEELKELRCAAPTWSQGEQILSCPDALAQALREYLEDYKV